MYSKSPEKIPILQKYTEILCARLHQLCGIKYSKTSLSGTLTKWDTLLSGTLGAGPIGVPLGEVLLYRKFLAFGFHLARQIQKFSSK